MSPASRKSAAKKKKADVGGPRIAWWWAPVGLAAGALAVWALLTSEPGPAARPAPAPQGEIGDASREKLREILREADSGEPAP